MKGLECKNVRFLEVIYFDIGQNLVDPLQEHFLRATTSSTALTDLILQNERPNELNNMNVRARQQDKQAQGQKMVLNMSPD